jgi:hemolysin III
MKITIRHERIANSVTHGTGALLAFAATIGLTSEAVAAGDPWRIATYPVFGLSMILLYLASTIYHWNRSDALRPRLKLFDHISIFYLIAGTYTPVTLVALRGSGGWWLLGTVWLLALGGTVFKLNFLGRFPILSTVFYAGMGWTALFAVAPVTRNLNTDTLVLMLAGGILYTGGLVFYAWRRLPFNHAVWHLFVLGGTACHVAGILKL